MAWQPRGDPAVIGFGRRRHEGKAARRQTLHGGVDVLAAAGDMLDAFTLILVQKLLDLTFAVGGFIQGYPDLSAGARQGARIKAGEFPGDVKIANLTEVEEILIELIPAVHGAAKHIVGQMIDVVYAATGGRRVALAEPIEFVVIRRTLGAIGVDEIDQTAADPKDRRSVDGLGARLAVVWPRASLQRMRERLFRINHPPGHRGRARAMTIDKSAAETQPIGIEDVVDAALAIKLDGAQFMPRDKLETHLFEQYLQSAGLGVGEFHEFKTIGARRVFGTDFGGRRVVRKRTHLLYPVLINVKDSEKSAGEACIMNESRDIDARIV